MSNAPVTTIRRTPADISIIYYDNSHRYKIARGDEPSRFVPSVSTILDKAISKNLTGWAERLTVAGIVSLTQLGRQTERMGPDALLAEMHAQGLRYYQKRDDAADRGTSVHRAFEELAEGKVPDLKQWPIEQRGYIQAVVRWWLEYDPDVLFAELMVASWKHQYAGRMDLLAKIDRHVTVVDLKTSRAIRESHHYQTAGYRVAVEESGYPTPDFGAILRVGDDGTFEYVESHATAEQWIALKRSFDAQKEFETEGKRITKELKAA